MKKAMFYECIMIKPMAVNLDWWLIPPLDWSAGQGPLLYCVYIISSCIYTWAW